METKGYVHVYTGNGKGKTTAAFGLALRALCAGKGVYVGQFVKSMKYNETKIERLFNGSRHSVVSVSNNWGADALSEKTPSWPMRKRHAKDGPVVRTCSEAGNTMW